MTPAEQIHLETTTLEKQITDLIAGFEKRTGVAVQQLDVVDFRFSSARRRHGQPLSVTVTIDLPPPPQPEQPKQV